jgi:hypothetical protein
VLHRLTAAVADMEDVHGVAIHREQNPIDMWRAAVEQVAYFKGKERTLGSQRAAFRDFGQGFDRVL